MEAIERWLEENTFSCPALKAKISLAQCEEIRKRPTIKEFADGKPISGDKNCRPEACDTCTRYKQYQQEKEICICESCKKPFKAYKNGAFKVKKICPECLKERKRHKKQKQKALDKISFSAEIIWELMKKESLLEPLMLRAQEEIRTIEQQIVYELKRRLMCDGIQKV